MSGTEQTLTVTLPADVVQYLGQQAKERGKTATQVLLDALGTEKFVREKAQGANSKVLIVEKGRTSELVA